MHAMGMGSASHEGWRRLLLLIMADSHMIAFAGLSGARYEDERTEFAMLWLVNSHLPQCCSYPLLGPNEYAWMI